MLGWHKTVWPYDPIRAIFRKRKTWVFRQPLRGQSQAKLSPILIPCIDRNFQFWLDASRLHGIFQFFLLMQAELTTVRLYKVDEIAHKITPESLRHAIPTTMISFWRHLHHWDFGASNANNDTMYDEENLGRNSGLLQYPRRSFRLVRRPKRATVLILMIDLMVVWLLLQIFQPLIILLRRNEELFGSRVALHTNYTPDDRHQTNSSWEIPQILHQTTANETIPDKWIESQKSCKEAYSDFEYKVSIIRTS